MKKELLLIAMILDIIMIVLVVSMMINDEPVESWVLLVWVLNCFNSHHNCYRIYDEYE